MPFYSGGNFHTSFTCAAGTRQEIVTGIQNALSANGWSVVSGGGSGDVVLQSATPTGGAALRLRVEDPGAGNCATCKIQQAGGGNESQAYYLLPGAGKVFNVWGCQYQAFVFTGSSKTNSREYFACGALYVPDWLRPSVSEALWANGNGLSDTEMSPAGTWRELLSCSGGGWVCHTAIVNGAKRERKLYGGPASEDLMLAAIGASGVGGGWPARRFIDNTGFQIDAWVSMHCTDTNEKGKFCGALWDAAVVSETFAGGTLKTIDGRSFYALTDSCSEDPPGLPGTLFLL